jgi:UDP-N-acetyl-D-mannosaminuronic acid transferase (WecB/TagA/CpsF family)
VLKKPSENKGRINTGLQDTKEDTMSQTVFERTAEHVAESAHQASRVACAAADAIIEDGVGVVRRAAKQGGDAAEEFLNDTTLRLQRHPMITVVTTFAVGFTAGALIGWMIRRS